MSSNIVSWSGSGLLDSSTRVFNSVFSSALRFRKSRFTSCRASTSVNPFSVCIRSISRCKNLSSVSWLPMLSIDFFISLICVKTSSDVPSFGCNGSLRSCFKILPGLSFMSANFSRVLSIFSFQSASSWRIPFSVYR